MKFRYTMGIIGGLLCVYLSSAAAAPAQQSPTPVAAEKMRAAAELSNVRFSNGRDNMRIVFDFKELPAYTVTTQNNGTRIVIDFAAAVNHSGKLTLPLKDPIIKNISFAAQANGGLRAVLDLNYNAVYKVHKLKNPNRVFIDIIKDFDQEIVQDFKPGLKLRTLVRGRHGGLWTINTLEVDLSKGILLRPALAKGYIDGRDALSGIVKENNAYAGINSSYFEPNGEVLGLTEIDGKIVSSTYLPRTAFAVDSQGRPHIGQAAYEAVIQLPGGTKIAAAGINCERTENAVILYNSAYGKRTNTNIYGREYIIKNGRVAASVNNNAQLTDDAVVISVHGTAQNVFKKLKVGDAVSITEQLTGTLPADTVQVVGVGPALVHGGAVALTTAAEQFGADVADGRAPRTAVGIKADGRVLLTVVDGRQNHSLGFTLEELAGFMIEAGAVEAVNFDGGGSSEMIIDGDIINQPSDGGERRIGAALLVMDK